MSRKWNKEVIAAAIRDLHGRGHSLSYSSANRDQRALLQAAVRYFGTWEAAVTTAGYDYTLSLMRPRAETTPAGHESPPRRWRRKRKLRLFD